MDLMHSGLRRVAAFQPVTLKSPNVHFSSEQMKDEITTKSSFRIMAVNS